MEGTLIHVGLYGDGSRRARRRAEYIYCEHAKDCSLYKDGKCFCVKTIFSQDCPLGNVVEKGGETKRSKKFAQITAEAEASPCYGALKYPYNDIVARIGDQFLIDLPFVKLKIDGENILVKDPGLIFDTMIAGNIAILTPENLNRICEFKPVSMLDSAITKYQEKTIPTFLSQFKKLFSDEYSAFIEQYPQYQGSSENVSYIGRSAKLATCNRECEYSDGKNNTFRFDGEYMVCDAFFGLFEPRSGGHYYQVRVKLDESMVCKITDNAQVLPDTVFVD